MLEDDSRGDVIVGGNMEKKSKDSKHHGKDKQKVVILEISPDSKY